MKYCVIKDTIRTITQGEDEESLKNQALGNMLDDKYFTLEDVEILTEEEYQERVELKPKPTVLPSVEERMSAIEEVMMMLI